MNLALFAIAISFAVSFAATPAAGKLASRFGVIAWPGGRHVHSLPTPLWGGLGIYAGFMVAVALAIALHPGLSFDKQIATILVAATVVAAVGLLDDKFKLSAFWQFLAIIVAAAILAWQGIRIQFITDRFHSSRVLSLGMWSVPITILWVFGVTKTVDLIDGLDGLAAGVCAIASTTLILMALQARIHQPHLAPPFMTVILMCSALLGACLGFLRFNYPPAKIFMGTIGAQFMGFILAASSIVGAFKMAALVALAVPVLALGVPIFDAIFVVLRRLAARQPLHQADMGHVHHRLLRRGLSPHQAILIIYGVTFAFSVTALVLFRLSLPR